jgi:M6 family metalloprotease-like protein
MDTRPESHDSSRLLLLSALSFLIILTLESQTAEAISPRPGLYDPETGLARTTGRPPPIFPEWFGKGARPLRALSGEGRALALLIDFPDRQADVNARPASVFDNLLFGLGVSPYGSLREFYIEQSYGTYDVTGETHGWLRTTDNYATTYDDGYYGFGGGGKAVTKAALDLVDPSVDFGLFDSDGPDGIPNSGDDDGYADACIIVYAGAGSHDTGDPSDIWAHQGGFDPNYLTNDPAAGGGFIRILSYTMQPEVNMSADGDSVMAGLGVFAHEYGHILGLIDLYDGSRDTWGIGYWCLMSYGAWLMRGDEVYSPAHLSAWCKEKLGWVTPVIVTQNLAGVVIPPVESDPTVYKVWRDGIPEEEYFLIENRQNVGFDDILPGSGLLIWHIDGDGDPYIDLVDLEEADGRDDLENGTGSRPEGGFYHPELGDSGDPYPGDSLNTVFDNLSYPSSLDNDQNQTDVSIEDIELDGINVRLSIIIDPDVATLFSSFQAKPEGLKVELTWKVLSDERITGFNVYRKRGGASDEGAVVNNSPIAPEERRFVDGTVRPGVTYYYVVSAILSDGSEVRSHSEEVTVQALMLALFQNYPNPFNPLTRIEYTLPEAVQVRLSIYTVEGKLIVTLEEGVRTEGKHVVTWDGKDQRGNAVSTGMYFYRLKAGRTTMVKKMVLLK